jgi:hypothetical protein
MIEQEEPFVGDVTYFSDGKQVWIGSYLGQGSTHAMVIGGIATLRPSHWMRKPHPPLPPDPYEYRITHGQRKQWDGEPDLSKEGWEEYEPWERFDYHEERRWRRPKEQPTKGSGGL